MAVSVDASPRARENAAQAALLSELATGDREHALAGLYAAHGRPIYRLGIMLLHDEGLAEDLVQETFVRLWRAAGRYDASRATVRTFVFTLARRAAVDLWRRRDGALPLGDHAPDPEDPAGNAAFADLVRRLDVREALDALSPAHREVLELQYHGDLTQTQVAARLGIPLGTVKSRTLYALRALGHELKERGLLD